MNNITTALLVTGSAVLIFSCGSKKADDGPGNYEGLMTQQAFDLTRIESSNGKKSYRFETPLMEAYDSAKIPYWEFTKGVKIETFADSTETVESTLISDYAIYFVERDLWEAKGNVVATNASGNKLETPQLFWDRITDKIYSNVDSKVTQGNDVIIGIGFESDSKFEDWEFRKPRGTVAFNPEPNREGKDVRTEGEDDAVDAEDIIFTQPLPGGTDTEERDAGGTNNVRSEGDEDRTVEEDAPPADTTP